MAGFSARQYLEVGTSSTHGPGLHPRAGLPVVVLLSPRFPRGRGGIVVGEPSARTGRRP
jgi:hypothetical protein